MRIETKFTPGQKVWGIYNNKVQEFLVETVEATSNFNYDTNGHTPRFANITTYRRKCWV